MAVQRDDVFHSVVNLYKEKSSQLMLEYPLHVKLAGERAIDFGGVSRDMFSAFYDEAYETFFDGTAYYEREESGCKCAVDDFATEC